MGAVRTPTGPASEVTLAAIGLDPAGTERALATATLAFEAGSGTAEVRLALPPELRNRVTRFEVPGLRSAGAVALADDGLRRREVGLVAGGGRGRGARPAVAAPLPARGAGAQRRPRRGHALGRGAGQPRRDRAGRRGDAHRGRGGGGDRLGRGRAACCCALPGRASPPPTSARATEDPLLPVRLRAGGRTVGGAMSWGEPKALAPFPEDSPFFGLAVPDDVTVSEQVLAEPDPTLADRVMASLADGTPLVTAQGRSARAGWCWSTSPPTPNGPRCRCRGCSCRCWSGSPSPPARPRPRRRSSTGPSGCPTRRSTPSGSSRPLDTEPGIPGERLATGLAGPDLRPGLYAGEDRRIAVNAAAPDLVLAPAAWPASVRVEGIDAARALPLKGALLAAALAHPAARRAGLADAVGPPDRAARGAARGAVVLAAWLMPPGEARAQEVIEPPPASEADAFALAATEEVVLAHVLTGDAQVDELAEAGLLGLSNTLWARTAVEPAAPHRRGHRARRDRLPAVPLLAGRGRRSRCPRARPTRS